jgi:hypothetical protein
MKDELQIAIENDGLLCVKRNIHRANVPDYARLEKVHYNTDPTGYYFWLPLKTFDLLKDFIDCDVPWEYLAPSDEMLKKEGFERKTIIEFLESKLTPMQLDLYKKAGGNTVIEFEVITMDGLREIRAALFATKNMPVPEGKKRQELELYE